MKVTPMFPPEIFPDRAAALAKRATEQPMALEVSDEILHVAARLTTSFGGSDQIVLVTGYDKRDDAPDLAAQLAIGLARVSQSRVVLIDGDRSTPTLHEVFGVPRNPGWGELIDKEVEFPEACRAVAEGVDLVTAGKDTKSVPLPDSVRVGAELRRCFRYIVIVGGPLLTNAEAVTYSAISDGVLLALRAGVRTREEVTELRREVARHGRRLLGAVLREGK